MADIVLILHFFYVLFVVTGFIVIGLGAPLGWKWIRNRTFRLFHLAAIAFVGLEGVIGMVCPLTALEYQLRRAGGGGAEEGAFIARLVSKLLYYDFPPWIFTMAYLLMTLLALALMFIVPPRWRRKRR